jgi:DNA-binding HxlR family transcriptional regulator
MALKGLIRSKITSPEITSRTLSARLKILVDQSIVDRKQFAEIPPRVEYSLTEMGKDLEKIVEEVEAFGNRWMCG